MKQTNVTIKREFGPLQFVTYVGQTVHNVVVDSKNFAFGLWRGLFVAAFNANDTVWHVCDVPAGMQQNLLDRIAQGGSESVSA